MIDTKRHLFINFEKFLANSFSGIPLTANQITLISGTIAFSGLYFLIKTDLLWAAILFFISAILDLVDGAVARKTKTVSRVGAYLDTIIDRYVEGFIYFGLLFLSLPNILLPGSVWVFLSMFGALVTTYAKAAAKEKDLVNQELKGGLMSRGERLFLIFIALILGIIYPDFVYMTYVLALIAILANITAIQRVYSAIKLNK